jgi:hypothetical protein
MFTAKQTKLVDELDYIHLEKPFDIRVDRGPNHSVGVAGSARPDIAGER